MAVEPTGIGIPSPVTSASILFTSCVDKNKIELLSKHRAQAYYNRLLMSESNYLINKVAIVAFEAAVAQNTHQQLIDIIIVFITYW